MWQYHRRSNCSCQVYQTLSTSFNIVNYSVVHYKQPNISSYSVNQYNTNVWHLVTYCYWLTSPIDTTNLPPTVVVSHKQVAIAKLPPESAWPSPYVEKTSAAELLALHSSLRCWKWMFYFGWSHTFLRGSPSAGLSPEVLHFQHLSEHLSASLGIPWVTSTFHFPSIQVHSSPFGSVRNTKN